MRISLEEQHRISLVLQELGLLEYAENLIAFLVYLEGYKVALARAAENLGNNEPFWDFDFNTANEILCLYNNTANFLMDAMQFRHTVQQFLERLYISVDTLDLVVIVDYILDEIKNYLIGDQNNNILIYYNNLLPDLNINEIINIQNLPNDYEILSNFLHNPNLNQQDSTTNAAGTDRPISINGVPLTKEQVEELRDCYATLTGYPFNSDQTFNVLTDLIRSIDFMAKGGIFEYYIEDITYPSKHFNLMSNTPGYPQGTKINSIQEAEIFIEQKLQTGVLQNIVQELTDPEKSENIEEIMEVGHKLSSILLNNRAQVRLAM